MLVLFISRSRFYTGFLDDCAIGLLLMYDIRVRDRWWGERVSEERF